MDEKKKPTENTGEVEKPASGADQPQISGKKDRAPDGKFAKGNSSRFRKNQSGNPKGRPPGLSFKAKLTQFLQGECEVGPAGKKQKRKREEVLMEALFNYAVKGNPSFMNQLLDRTHGKVKEGDVLDGSGESQVIVI